MFLDERFTHKCSLIKRSLVRFVDQPVPKALPIFQCESTVNAVCTVCIRFVSVHSICADLPPHKLFSVRHYTNQNLRACVLIKELQTVAERKKT